jgi:hypothetical protein
MSLINKRPSFFRRFDGPTLTTRDGGVRAIYRSQDFQSPALTLLPQGKRFFDRIFLAMQATAFDGLADKRFLSSGELHFHITPLYSDRGGSACIHSRAATKVEKW